MKEYKYCEECGSKLTLTWKLPGFDRFTGEPRVEKRCPYFQEHNETNQKVEQESQSRWDKMHGIK